MQADLKGRTALITGANTGIGRSMAAMLAARGAHVVLACRSEAKTRPVIDEIQRTTGNDHVEFLPLDLNDLAAVRDSAKQYLASKRGLDVLINNAGLAGQRGITKDGFELAFGVNHLGHFLFTQLLLERVEKSAPARIVNVSSASHYQAKGIDFDALRGSTRSLTGMAEYAVSKLANVLYTQELARRLNASKVSVYAVHPGVIASDVWRSVPWPVRSLMKLAMASTDDGARNVLRCATASDLAAHSGRYYHEGNERSASRHATAELATELWQRSEQWTAKWMRL